MNDTLLLQESILQKYKGKIKVVFVNIYNSGDVRGNYLKDSLYAKLVSHKANYILIKLAANKKDNENHN